MASEWAMKRAWEWFADDAEYRKRHGRETRVAMFAREFDAARREGAEAVRERVGELLTRNGCDCDCGHHPEDHDDCDRCLACQVDTVLGGDDGE